MWLRNLRLTEDWLGGLDSNQDNQIQNLMYCQLYDLPAERQKRPPAAADDPHLLYWRGEISSTGCDASPGLKAAGGSIERIENEKG